MEQEGPPIGPSNIGSSLPFGSRSEVPDIRKFRIQEFSGLLCQAQVCEQIYNSPFGAGEGTFPLIRRAMPLCRLEIPGVVFSNGQETGRVFQSLMATAKGPEAVNTMRLSDFALGRPDEQQPHASF